MIRVIGSIVVAIFLMAIPILATLSLVREWDGFIKSVLVLGTVAEVISLACVLYNNAE